LVIYKDYTKLHGLQNVEFTIFSIPNLMADILKL